MTTAEERYEETWNIQNALLSNNSPFVSMISFALTSVSSSKVILCSYSSQDLTTELCSMQITDDITTDDATIVLYHDGSTTSTLTFVFLLLARQSPNQFGLCSCLVRRFFVSVVTGTAYPNLKCCRVLYHHSAGAHLQRTGETIAPSAFSCFMAASTSLRSRPLSSAILPALRG